MSPPGALIAGSKYSIPVYSMRAMTLRCLPILLLLLWPASWAAAQQDKQSVEQRLDRLERLVESRGLADILMRLNALQEEVRQLRGENEEQAHAIEDLKKRQRELYIDLDRRLLQLERGSGRQESSRDDISQDTKASSSNSSAVPATIPDSKQPATAGPETPRETPLSVGRDEREAYQAAFNLLRELQYDKAIDAFEKFLRNYPDGRYAHIARYWLGEANYAQRHFKQAISSYEGLIARYPDSPKVAEAMLKIGYSHHNLQADKPAREILEKLIASYPGTTEASQARNLLQKIRARQSGE